MKKIANFLAIASILLIVWSVSARFMSGINALRIGIGWGLMRVEISPFSILIVGIFLMLIALFARLVYIEKKGFIKDSASKGRMFSWVISVIIVGLFVGGLLSFSFIKLVDQRLFDRVNQIYYRLGLWQSKWLNMESSQIPCDNWVMQEIISEVKPDFIIETGTGYGGTALFYATVLEKVNENGKVITVDIQPHSPKVAAFKTWREKVRFIQGSSTSPDVIDAIAKQVKGHKVLVTLDSDHSKAHVLKELNLYSDFVSVNSYLVAQDTNIDKLKAMPGFGPGPMAAVKEFLKSNKNFIVDRNRERYILTNHPSGFLKRVK